MLRQTKWQMEASDAVSWSQDQALNATIFLLRETGPTSFFLKEDEIEKRTKVSLGDPHTCTCDTFKREKSPCKHICWVILKKFKWPRTHELSYQHGLVEREINQLLSAPRRPGIETSKYANDVTDSNNEGILKQREISKVDVCPICQEELLTKHAPVTYCKFGCGNSIHIKCMKVWAEHQRHSADENDIKCPVCRASFGSFYSLLEELRNSSGEGDEGCRLDVHFSTSCGACNMCPVKVRKGVAFIKKCMATCHFPQGKCYKCTTCTSFFLCNACFHVNKHRQHSFEFRIKRTHRWRPAKSRTRADACLEMTILNDLSSREITENDYELLLQLGGHESGAHSSPAVDLSGLPSHVINSLPLMKVRHGGKLLAPGKQCRLCLRSYEVGQYVRKLPECNHVFHRDCIDQWLSEDHRRCPIDQKLVGMHRRTTPSTREVNIEDTEAFHDADISQLVVPGIGIAKLQQSSSKGVLHGFATRKEIQKHTPSRRLVPEGHNSNGPLDMTFSDVLDNINSVVSRGGDATKDRKSIHTAMTNRSRSSIERRLATRRKPIQRANSAAKLNEVHSLWLSGNSVVNKNISES